MDVRRLVDVERQQLLAALRGSADEDRLTWPDEQLAEVSWLLPGWQAAQLEQLACSRGLTLGRFLRLLIGDYLLGESGPRRMGMALPG